MKITYIKLVNVAGIKAGMGLYELEIDFSKSVNRIVAIQAKNGSGKSVLLASLSPFAYVTSLDERSSLPYIIAKKTGYKEIRYDDGEDKYIIKHHYKPAKDSWLVKSYFIKNGVELNENGNVRSFESLVESEFGLTTEKMRLIRIGSNVNSFISLSPGKRKDYLGKLIEEIDLYMAIYKKVNDDLRVIRTLTQSNASSLYNLHITDPVVEKDKLDDMRKSIKKHEREKEGLVKRIGKIDGLIRDNNIESLRKSLEDAESSIREFGKVSGKINDLGLSEVTVDKLMDKRTAVTNRRIDIQSSINSLRLSIDNIHTNINRLELNLRKITAQHDLRSLINNIETLKDSVAGISRSVIEFKPLASSEDLQDVLAKLNSFNQIAKTIISLGNKPIAVYVKLYRSGNDIEKWLKDQAKKSLSRLNEADLKSVIDQVFGDDMLVTPNCVSEFNDCPYYRVYSLVCQLRDNLDDENYSDEDLRYIQIIVNNVDRMLNELDHIKIAVKLPDAILETLDADVIIDRLDKRLVFFDTVKLQEYAGITKEHELYVDMANRLANYQQQLAVYQQAGVGSVTDEIKRQNDQIELYKNDIAKLQSELDGINKQLADVENQISLVSRYNELKKYQSMMHHTVESTNKILVPLENAANEKNELQFQMRTVDNLINQLRDQYHLLERKLDQYDKLVEEGKKLSKQNKDLNTILEAVSTKKGIPVIFMKQYLSRIQKLANDLLRLIYDDFRLAEFNVTPDVFEIPYIKGNNQLVPDIKYASQSELALGTMAVSFALAHTASDKYNILCLDEIDSALDADNRNAFLKMLYMQMGLIKADQVFLISQNLSQLTNLSMDVIRLSTDYSVNNKLQNVIYSVDDIL